jgi:hypothetical protein
LLPYRKHLFVQLHGGIVVASLFMCDRQIEEASHCLRVLGSQPPARQFHSHLPGLLCAIVVALLLETLGMESLAGSFLGALPTAVLFE